MGRLKGTGGVAKRGGIYWARFRVDGVLVQRSLQTRSLREAKKRLRALRETLTNKGTVNRSASQESCSFTALQAHALRYLSSTVSPSQVSDYNRSLLAFIECCNPESAEDVNELSLLTFREARLSGDKPVSPKTVNKQIGHILIAYRIARESKLHNLPDPTYKPLRHIPEKERRALTLDEIKALLEATKRPQERLMWLTALKTGMRKGELVGLTWKHLRADKIVLPAKGTKARKTREIPLPCDFIKELRAHREHESHVFVTPRGTPWHNNLLTRFYKRCRDAGIRDGKPGGSVDIHSLRVTFVTQAIEHGADPRSVQEIVGHSTVELTLKVYTRSTDSSKRKVSERLPY